MSAPPVMFASPRDELHAWANEVSPWCRTDRARCRAADLLRKRRSTGEMRIMLGHDAPTPTQDAIERATDDDIADTASVLWTDTRDEVAQDAVAGPPLVPVLTPDEYEARRERLARERADSTKRREAERIDQARARIRDSFPSPIDLAALATDMSEPEWLIDGFLLAGNQAHLSAPAKSGKSLVALWAAANLVVGRDPFTWAKRDPLSVTYLDFEMTRQDVKRRLFLDGMEFEPGALSEGLRYYQHPPMPPLDTAEGGAWVRELIERDEPALVVIDTLSRVTEGGENDSDTYRNFYRHVGHVLKETGVALIRLDHEGHGGTNRARGSSAKSDDVDVIWSMSKVDGDGLKLTNLGDRTGYAADVLNLRRTDDPPLGFRRDGADVWPPGTAAKAAWLDAAGVPLDASRRKAREMLKAAGLTPGTDAVLTKALAFRNRPAAAGLPPEEVVTGDGHP